MYQCQQDLTSLWVFCCLDNDHPGNVLFCLFLVTALSLVILADMQRSYSKRQLVYFIS